MTTASITLKIHQYDKNLASFIYNQTSIGEIVTEAMMTVFDNDQLKKKYNGQIDMFKRLHTAIQELFSPFVTQHTNLENYWAKHGKKEEGTLLFHTIDSELESEARKAAKTLANEWWS